MKTDLSILSHCTLCPRRCGADRQNGERGFCGAGAEVLVAHYGPHFGEEPPISGTRGSGNVFFSYCNLRCLFCQNYQISQFGQGRSVSVAELADIFFLLKERGCHNINLVSPTPWVPFIAAAIARAKDRGIGIPFLYNTNGYDSVETLRSLEGLIDIYLPDFKYFNPAVAVRLSGASPAAPYQEAAAAAIMEMKRQVGDLVIENGIAKRGILMRHLVLPGGLAGTEKVFAWIQDNLGVKTWVALMSQYLPLHNAGQYALINRRVRQDEYDAALSFLIDSGFDNAFIQELDSASVMVPDFDDDEPFQQRGRGP